MPRIFRKSTLLGLVMLAVLILAVGLHPASLVRSADGAAPAPGGEQPSVFLGVIF